MEVEGDLMKGGRLSCMDYRLWGSGANYCKVQAQRETQSRYSLGR
jgi:hypothetical protein